jgi:hypothetical protein
MPDVVYCPGTERLQLGGQGIKFFQLAFSGGGIGGHRQPHFFYAGFDGRLPFVDKSEQLPFLPAVKGAQVPGGQVLQRLHDFFQRLQQRILGLRCRPDAADDGLQGFQAFVGAGAPAPQLFYGLHLSRSAHFADRGAQVLVAFDEHLQLSYQRFPGIAFQLLQAGGF